MPTPVQSSDLCNLYSYTIPANTTGIRGSGAGKFFTLRSCSDPNALRVGFNASDKGVRLDIGAVIGVQVGGSDFSGVWLSNTSGAPITVEYYIGAASFTQPPVAASGSALLGQATMAGSTPVVIASNQSALNVTATGNVAAGAGVAGNPLQVAGSDGTNVQRIKTDTAGNQVAVGAVAAGAAIGTVAPVMVAGSDGTNVQRIKVDASGNQIATGPVAAGSAVGTTGPVQMSGSDGTNVRRILTDTTGRQVIVGQTAHDSAVSTDAPILQAAEARSTERAAVASADVARLVCDLVGKLIVLPYANPENFLSGKTAAMTGTGDTTVIAGQGAGVRSYITTIIITNDHATVGTEVVIKDGATELFRVYVPPLNGTAGPNSIAITLPTPLRTTANTALNAANITTGSNTYVAAVGYKGV